MPISTKKLAYVTSMATGGLSGFNYRELAEMKRLGTDITLFITKFTAGPYMPPKEIPVYTVNPMRVLLSQLKDLLSSPQEYLRLFIESLRSRTVVDFLIAQRWAPIMQQAEVNWIHCHWGDHKLYIGYYCHQIVGIPLSVTLHGYDLYANPNWKMFERSLKACAQIITISEYNRRMLIDKYGELGKRVKVIRLSADLPADPDTEEKMKRVLIVGGFQHRKGYDILMEALHILNRDDIHLWVVGYKGPVDVAGLIKKYGLQGKVTILGAVSDEVLKLLYVFCDIFCLPSRFGPDGIGEGLPVALMEAMSYGKPIVSTHHTGIPELVPEILVEENNPQELAQAIAKLADDAGSRRGMGRRNRSIVASDYSNANVKQLLEALKLE